MRFLTWLLSYVVGVAAAAWLLDGIRFTGPRQGTAELEQKAVPLLVVALVLGLVSAVVRPVITLLSLPLVLLTLGLFLVVINAGMLLLTGEIAEGVGLGFRVDGFWTAVGGALVVSVAAWTVEAVLGDR